MPELPFDNRPPGPALSPREVQACLDLLQLNPVTVSFHQLLKASTELESVYLPDGFREILVKAVLFAAGDCPRIREFYRQQLEHEDQALSQNDLARLSRVSTAELTSAEALEFLPDAALALGSVREALEDMLVIHLSDKRVEDRETEAFVGDYLRAGARLGALRFFNSFFDHQSQE